MMETAVIGAGPVGCFAALQLLERGHKVVIFDNGRDSRKEVKVRNSFNLTLTTRSLKTFGPELLRKVEKIGVKLYQRVIHKKDGSVAYQSYGTKENNFLLSIPREAFHFLLMEECETKGIQIKFTCPVVKLNCREGKVFFLEGKISLKSQIFDAVFCCDGANSICRGEFQRNGLHLDIVQEFYEIYYLEFFIGPEKSSSGAPIVATKSEHKLLRRLSNSSIPASSKHGLHVWPRDGCLMIAQPNSDMTYTATLFSSINFSDDPLKFLEANFSKALPLLDDLEKCLRKPSISMRKMKASKISCFKCVLLGDAAHSMPPFYGQGINCAIEGVSELFKILDNEKEVEVAFKRYSQQRVPSAHAITDLSWENWSHLASLSDRDLKREVVHRDGDRDFSAYELVAFSDVPYEKAYNLIKLHRSESGVEK